MSSVATLHDIAARFGDGKDAQLYKRIIELQSKTNKILQVLPMKQANSKTIEKAVVREALPEVAWRMINRGVPMSKSASKQVSFSCGHMQSFATIDEELLRINGNSPEWRLSENQAFQEAMNQEMATTMFYGDEKVNPAKFTGLGAYYYSKAQDAVYSDRIIDCGGTGNNLTSVWIVCMGQNSLYGIFPEGTHAGFEYKDQGLQFITDPATGLSMNQAVSKYDWGMGLALVDPRYVVRLCNIDMTKLTGADASAFMENMIRAYNRIENPDMGTMAIFCNRDMETYFDIAATKVDNVRLSLDDFGGKKTTHFRGAPILRCDAILSTEAQIV